MLRSLLFLGVIGCSERAEPVVPAAPLACSDAGGHSDVASVVAAAVAFRSTLTDEQRAKLDLPFTREVATMWSNLPVGLVPRRGVRLGDLDGAQTKRARALIAAATSSCGRKLVNELRLADDLIAPLDRDPQMHMDWGAGNYFIAFLGAPSASAPWELQFGGHHISLNLTFNGHLPSATPMFFGAEPVKFTTPDGKAHAPMQRQSMAMGALANALAVHPDAHLSGTFTDVVKGVVIIREEGKPPSGGYDTGYPFAWDTTDRGMLVGKLAPDEQKLVREAIESYASLPGDALSYPLIATYEMALGETYVGVAGGNDLAKSGMYVRIDGPRIWMEFIVQDGVAFPDIPHYHALWRDKLADYGGELK